MARNLDRFLASTTTALALIALAGTAAASGPITYGTIAYTGQPAQGLPAGTIFADLADPRVSTDNTGLEAFWAKLSGGGTTANNDTSIWTNLGGTYALAFRKGDAVVGTTDLLTGFGTPVLGPASRITTTGSLNTAAQTMNLALLSDDGPSILTPIIREDASFTGLGLASAGGGGSLVFRSGDGTTIKRSNAGTLVDVAKSGDPAPDTGLAGAAFSRLWEPSQDQGDGVIFRADITFTGQTAPMSGIFASRGGALHGIARFGTEVNTIEPGAIIGDLSATPRLAGSAAVFWAFVTSPFSTQTVTAIFREESGVLAPVIRNGAAAPGLPGLTVSVLDRAVEVADDGTIVFSGGLSGPGVSAANNSAIWTWKPVGGFGLVAREGDQVPGAGSGTVFATLGRAGLSSSGRAAFTAWLGGAGITGASNYGLFAGNSLNQLALIARTGQSFTLPAPGSGTKIIKDIIFDHGPAQSGLSQFHADGTLAFRLIFTDASSGLFTAKVPACFADVNGDGFVTADDFDLYVELFEAGDAGADFNNDGFVSGDDFDGFVAAFVAGC